MESLHQEAILEFHPDTLEAVRKLYNLDKPGRMAEAIDILEEWIKKQEHFTKKEFNRDYLERLIIRSKGLLERAKMKLDRICTTKTLLPQYFGVYNFKEELDDLNVLKDAVMPKMTSDYYRIYFNKHIAKEYSATYVMNYCRKGCTVWEYLLRHDYSIGFILIVDLTETNVLSLVMRLEPNLVRHVIDIFLGCYSMRLKQMHIISTTKAADTIVTLLKQLLSKKLGDRIFVYGDKESLKNVVDVDLLPKDYGGQEPPLVELHDKWLDVLSSKGHMDYLKMVHGVKTDESLRKLDKFNDQYFGTSGTFRTMTVD